MADQSLIKFIKIRQKIEKLEEELQKIKWDISASKVSKVSVVDLGKGILGSKFEKGIKYQKRLRKEWEKRMRKMGL
jgi:hypothetical protein